MSADTMGGEYFDGELVPFHYWCVKCGHRNRPGNADTPRCRKTITGKHSWAAPQQEQQESRSGATGTGATHPAGTGGGGAVVSGSAPQSILSQAQEAVTDRETRYGDCTEVFSITMEMFNAYRRGRKGATGAQDTAVFNICQKIARISCGQGHRDNWVDIAGYADRGGEASE